MKTSAEAALLTQLSGSGVPGPLGPEPATVVGPTEAAWEFLPVAGIEREARTHHPTFTRRIEPANARFWNWDEDILDATLLNGTKLHKFSWNPVTGEFLLIGAGNHSSVRGKAPFDDYVRGIVLRQMKKITFRPFYPTWMQNRSLLQQFHEESDEDGGRRVPRRQHAARRLKPNA